MSAKYAKLLGLGAFAACAGFIAFFGLIDWISRHTSTGGIMPVLSVVTWIALTLVLVSLIIVHVAIGRQLLYLGDGGGPRGV